jgi:hypothetical protein
MSNTITRMLPFRQINENDVINMFSLDTITGEAGSRVKISSANLDLDPVNLIERADSLGFQNYLGNASSLYPEVPYKVTKVANTGERPIGILLKDVRSVDENGENLQYYPRKKEELQCVLSGEAVPIATRGIFMLNSRALAGGLAPAINSYAIPSANGTLTGVAAASATATQKEYAVGKFIATGSRASQQDTDEYAGVYAVLKLEL